MRIALLSTSDTDLLPRGPVHRLHPDPRRGRRPGVAGRELRAEPDPETLAAMQPVHLDVQGDLEDRA